MRTCASCGLVEDQIAPVQGELIMHCWNYEERSWILV